MYDPALYNDRLLLGLKGTMSEAELHILKQRMYQGRLSKAQRGDLQFALPVGYVWDPTGEIQFDPDEQVQQVVRLIFRTFEELGTLGGLVRYLAHHRIQLGVRVREGPGKGELVWRRPNRATLQTMLKHPLYAGSYVYGRRQEDPHRKQPERPRTGRVVMTMDEWLVLLPNRCPAYISPEQYERNQARLQANRARADAMGAARSGPAHFSGLVVCARCGCRLGVHYDGSGHLHTYECVERWTRLRGTEVPTPGRTVPGCLRQPAGSRRLGASHLRVVAHRHRASGAGACRVGEARASTARTSRLRSRASSSSVPGGRTGASARGPDAGTRLGRETGGPATTRGGVSSVCPAQATPTAHEAEREAIRHLATDIPALWAAPTTRAADRKEIIRQVVERVVVDVQGTSERVGVRIEWLGGGHTEGVVIRPEGSLSELSTYAQIWKPGPGVDGSRLDRHRYCPGTLRRRLLPCPRQCPFWGTDD
jgi:hypothetical protein